MKLKSFNCTIEVSKNEHGYSDNYYVDFNDKGVTVSNPCITQSPEQTMFVATLIRDFISTAISFNARVDGFNRDNHLEEHSLKSILAAETETIDEIDANTRASDDINPTEVRHE